jgi:hypothetical protein
MFRPMIFAAAACVALLTTAANAQTAGGPPIAYVKRLSNGEEIHLISADGSERMRVYKARSKITITMLDLRPGGGEVAFLENYSTLKILAFDDLGRPLPGNPRQIRQVSSPCTVESPDYHPTNGSLLFVEGCGRNRAVWTVQSGASQRDEAPIFSAAVFRARWSRLGDMIYYIGLRDGALSSDPTYLYRRSSAPSGTAEEIGVLNTWSTFDVARVGEKLFWNLETERFKMLDVSVAGATTADAVLLTCPAGSRMTRSADDSGMVFQSPGARGRGNYIMIGGTNCSTPRALTGEGSWGGLDWRTELPAATTP